jgi:hypothetical protein
MKGPCPIDLPMRCFIRIENEPPKAAGLSNPMCPRGSSREIRRVELDLLQPCYADRRVDPEA